MVQVMLWNHILKVKGSSNMQEKYWKSIPKEYIEEWKFIFDMNREGANLSNSCPICNSKSLHRYYHKNNTGNEILYNDRGAEWQWCSSCRHYEHLEGVVPNWWSHDLHIDGNKLSHVPEIIDRAYKDPESINKWRLVPDEYLQLWSERFIEDKSQVHLLEECPICNKKTLYQYYSLNISKRIKYKKKIYQGQGAHWEWCSTCYHYKFDYLTYIPLEWCCLFTIEPWRLMTIPEPINVVILKNRK